MKFLLFQLKYDIGRIWRKWRKKLSGIFYIGGSDVFPPPLKTEEEAILLEQLGGEDDVKVKSVLIERNLRLVVYIARKFENTGVNVEDLISIGTIGLIKAINTFNPEKKIKLATYASRCIENEILMFLRKKSRRKVEVSFDEPLNIDYDGNELLLSDILGTDDDVVTKEFEKKENKRELLEAMSTLKERERQILQMRYGIQHEELTQKDIAKRLGISQSYISRLEKRIIAKLKVQMKNSQ